MRRLLASDLTPLKVVVPHDEVLAPFFCPR